MTSSTTLYRRVNEDLPVIEYTQEFRLRQDDGTWLIDFSSGPCCFSLGYDNRQVKAAIKHQMDMIPNAFSGWWASEASEAAGKAVKREFDRMNPDWFGRVVFQQGGGEAVDFACKIAAQYHLEGGDPRILFVARDYAYHGIGTMPAALSDDYPRYALMDPYLESARHRVIRVRQHDLRKTELVLKQNNVAAVIIEPVGGPTNPGLMEPTAYLHELRKLCDDTGTLLIFDEILCGAGRCGHISVAEMYGVWPDMVLLGKGISAGYQPVSAIVLSQKIIDRVAAGSGQLMFGTAHGAHSMGCAAVAATLNYIHDNDLCAHVRRQGPIVHELLDELVDLPIVSKCYGSGYLFGLWLGTPGGSCFNPPLEVHAMVRKAILKQGVVVYSKGGTMCGMGDFITIAPPFEMPDSMIEEAIAGVRKGLQEVQTQLGF
jgi:adenosylmethionine-8-amino-7-oxononanoate aminotransferase